LWPVKAKILDQEETEWLKMNILPPLIVRFVSNKGLTNFSATVEWCGVV
jgi:hypothetical protein